ncbi:uncharacterized protein METZ01_LOCUS384762 [marine metagenome]|uniref:Uncharacterized protein n=1 Tax=marine metagenome TaxID=408172 RepID=A0A382UDX7_9ZZZZ
MPQLGKRVILQVGKAIRLGMPSIKIFIISSTM